MRPEESPSAAAAPAPARSTLLRFGIVGALGFVVDSAVLYAAAGAAGWYVARLLSFLAAATFTWLLNRCFTFSQPRHAQAARKPLWAEYGQYLLSMSAGGAVNYGAYSVVISHWPGGSGGWTPLLGVAAGSVLGMAVNYVLARYVVFRRG